MAEAGNKTELVRRFIDEYEKKLKEKNELTEEKKEWARSKANEFAIF